ncbi:hypothetical protein NKI56_23980 [Mesorhizobium sp. M0622]|uniref:hypothetical protein n=1 Tax=unclassified Mesorhizobium TaxID=325217 RepID=UPI0033369AF9
MKLILVLAALALLSACKTSATPPAAASVPAPAVTTPSTAGFDPLPGDALKSLIVGKALHLSGTSDSTATYFADGRYDSVDANGHSTGTYAFQGDKVCVTFSTGPTRKGSKRCDQVAMIGTDYWLIATDGQRSKVKSIEPVAGSAPKPS